MADRDFQQLLDLITKTNAEIGRLQSRIEALQSRMTQGDLGTEQVRKLNTQIERLQANLSQRQVRQTELINQRDLANSTRGFDSLAKAIATLQSRLLELRSQRNAGGRLGLEEEITKYERALNSFESRMRNRYTPLGTRKTGAPVDFGNVDLESRLAGVGGQSPRELGRKAALDAIDDIQKKILQGAIDARTQSADAKFSAELDAIQRRSASFNRLSLAAQRYLSPAPLALPPGRPPLPPFGTNPFAGPGGGGSGGGPVYRIPTPGQDFDPTRDLTRQGAANFKANEERIAAATSQAFQRIFKAVELEAKRQAAIAGLSGSGGVGGFDRFSGRIEARLRQEAFQARRLPTYLAQRGAEGDVGAISSATDRAKQAQERATQSLRARVASEERYKQALDQAIRQGFTINNLTRVQTRGNAGIERLQFDRNEGGVDRRFDTYVNPAGRATPGVSNQFRSFGQGVIRDIGELTKWSIALAAIYGPLRKLQELTQIMIENQTRLAEATVTVSSAFLGQNEIFDLAADSAERAGESVGGVIDAFTQAYRAAGGTGNQVERLATAQKLLNDSLILSKLSTLDQAQAIDTLSAAVRQSGGDFNITTELLDSWVRVTKVANVDLATLSTGFAVLGDSAEAAGFDMDELNGLIALIAESSQSSGQEVANAARAIVGGLQSDQGIAALENLGIATRTAAGEMRSLEEILLEVSGLIESGVISPTQLSQLGQDIGGGVRRGAIVTTVLSNYSRAQEVAAQSSEANGDAQQALARQLETVQTSLTRLGNSFQELAQTLGTEGGFLGIITSGVDGMTALVRIFDSLTSVLGKATPALAAFIATSLILKQQGRGGIQPFITGLGTSLSRDENLARLAQVAGQNPANAPASSRFNQILQNNVLGTGGISGGVQGLLTAAIPAILNATNKEDRFGGVKAGANLIGGIGGGVIGALVAGSPVIGAAIGVAISEAFVNSTIARSTDIFSYQTGPTIGGPSRPGAESSDLDERLRQAEIQLYESIGFGNEEFGRFISAQPRTDRVLLGQINDAISTGNERALERVLERNRGQMAQLGITPELARQAFASGQEITVSPENRAYKLASQEARQAYDEALQARLARGDVEGQETAFTQMVAQNNTAYSALLDAIQDQAKGTLADQRAAGDVGAGEYARRLEAIGGADIKALQYYTALGDRVDEIASGADTAAEQFEVLSNVIINGTEEAIPQLTTVSGEIQTILNLLATDAGRTTLIDRFGSLEGANAELEELRDTLASLIKEANAESLLQNFKFPEIVGNFNEPRTREENQQIVSKGVEIQEKYLQSTGATQEQIEAFRQSIEDFKTPIEDAGDVIFDTVSGLEQRFYSLGEAALQAEGVLKSLDNFDIQQLDITSQQGAGLQGQIDYFSKYLSQNFPQYQQNPEEMGVIFSDYVTTVLHGDNLAIKLALDSLNDKAQKQLDGMYNIPEGATFWVPLTAAYYRPKSEGAGGLPPLADGTDDGAVNRNTSALETLTQAILNSSLNNEAENPFAGQYGASLEQQLEQREETRRAALGFRGDTGVGRQVIERREQALGFRGDTGQSRLAAESTSFIEELKNFFRNLLTPIGDRPGYGRGISGGNVGLRAVAGGNVGLRETAGGNVGLRGFSSLAPAQTVNPQLNAKLEFRMNNTTQLVVDGRILASIITPYLSSDLLRLEASQGTVTKRYII